MKTKKIYNTDKSLPLSEWVREEVKGIKRTKKVLELTSYLKIKKVGLNVNDSMGSFLFQGNDVYNNQLITSLFSTKGGLTGKSVVDIIPQNFYKTTITFTARTLINSSWINSKDEYKIKTI